MSKIPRTVCAPRASAARRSSLSLYASLAAVLCLALTAAPRAWAATATTTALTVTSGGSAVTSVASGSKVTLTATVTGNGVALTTGLVNFCDAAATYCEDVHILGSAQLTSAGTAVVNLRPGMGNHTYKAVFAGTTLYAKSTSGVSSLIVAGTSPTSTTLNATGTSGNYVLTATVTGLGNQAPTGTVPFVDTTNANASLGSASLGGGTATLGLVGSSSVTYASSTVRMAGDFNGDGYPDLAITSDTSASTLVILLNNGDGTFTTGVSLYLGARYSSAFAVGDFNGDGKLDMVVAGDAYTIYLGNGDGTFSAQPSVTLPAPSPIEGQSFGASSQTALVADFNNDGKADLVLVGLSPLELFGNGDGTFSAAVVLRAPISFVFGAGHHAYFTYNSASLGDFNSDGNIDINLILQGYSPQDTVLYGNGDGTFPTSLAGPQPASGLSSQVAADFDGDGVTDLALETSCTQLSVFYGGASSPFTRSAIVALDSTHAAGFCQGYANIGTLLAGDFNQDGNMDLLWAQPVAAGSTSTSNPPSELSIVLGPFGINQTPSYAQTLSQTVLNSLLVADFTGDGYPDVAATDSNGAFVLYSTQQKQTASAMLSNFSPPATGTHLIEATYPGDSHFGASTSGRISLTQSSADSLTLSASPAGSAYGQQVVLSASLDPYSIQGQSTNGETITFLRNGAPLGTAKLSYGVATLDSTSIPVGTGTLTASYLGDTNLGAATSNAVTFTVTQSTPVLNWFVTGAVYTGQSVSSTLLNATSNTPGTFTYTVTPSGGSPAPLTTTTILPAGTYTLTATLTPKDTASYGSGATLSVPYTVTPATLAITPYSASRVYGTANPAFSEYLSGGLNNDTFTVTASTTATTSSPVGTYPITYTVTGKNIANYTVTPVTGTLTITTATATVTWPKPAAIIYGTPLSSTQLNATSNAPGTFTYTPAAGTVLAASSQTLSLRFNPTDTTNYTVPQTVFAVALQVKPAPLTLTANDATRPYGAPNPTFTGTITGLVNNDQITETFSTPATLTSPAGPYYAIVPGPPGNQLPNYTITSTNGLLTITQAGTTTTLALSNGNTVVMARIASLTSGTPTGTVQFFRNGAPLGAGTVTGGVASFTFSPAPASGDVLSAQYGGDANFTPSSGSLTVGLLQSGISWATPAAIIYGTALSAAQLNASTSLPGTFSYSPAVGSVLQAGMQTLTTTFTPADPSRYSSATASIMLTVNKAPLALSTVNTARVYGASNPAFTGSVTGAVNGDTFTESFSTVATAASLVGSYPIVPSVTGSALSNYTVTPTNGALTISQAGTATTFALSNNNITLTSTVVSLTSQVPTGSVGFYQNQALVGTSALISGVATYTASSAPPANAVISAQYDGDVNFTQSASQPILLLSMQPASSSLTVSSAGSVSDAITLSAASGFTGALTLSCNGLPQGATCSFSPASVTFSGTATSASSTMTIHTGGTASSVQPLLPGSFERSFTLAAMFWIPGLFATACLRRKGKKRLPIQSLLVLLLFSGGAASLTACGGSPVTGSKSVTGTSSVNVIATGSNGFMQTTAVTLVIQ